MNSHACMQLAFLFCVPRSALAHAATLGHDQLSVDDPSLQLSAGTGCVSFACTQRSHADVVMVHVFATEESSYKGMFIAEGMPLGPSKLSPVRIRMHWS